MTKHIAIGLVILSVLLLSVSIKLIRSSHVGQGCYDAGVAHERASADWQQQNADGIVVNPQSITAALAPVPAACR
ncbi:MAG: hypothetical protein RB191_15455 [Terriglobia bacterium]|nr:hypothetical protein [Terriglobia bacterium]